MMANYLPSSTVGELHALRQGGAGVREIARVLGISKNTVSRYLPDKNTASCPCGKLAGHNGWCAHRLDKSERRQAYLSGAPVPPAPSRRSRVLEAVSEKRTWLGLERFMGCRLPADEMYGAIGEINRLTARLHSQIRDDVRHEMIVSCLEGRCPRSDLERAVPTFISFVMRCFVWREDAIDYDISGVAYSGSFQVAE